MSDITNLPGGIEEANSYVADPNDLKELARLVSQDRGMTLVMPQPFSAEQWDTFHRFLDIGCGPGGVVLDMASAHPHCDCVGIDISQNMLRYAEMLAHGENVQNAQFLSMDATKPLAFPDESFDLIYGRFMYSFLTPQYWPVLLSECFRLLRPGGYILVADHETSFGNKAAYEQLSAILTQAGFVAGRSFSPTGRSSGLSAMLKQLLEDAGFQQIQERAYTIEFSPGGEGFETWKDDLLLMTHSFLPFVVKAGVTTQEEVETLLQTTLQDLQDPKFHAITFQIMAWATKGERSDVAF